MAMRELHVPFFVAPISISWFVWLNQELIQILKKKVINFGGREWHEMQTNKTINEQLR